MDGPEYCILYGTTIWNWQLRNVLCNKDGILVEQYITANEMCSGVL